MKKKTSEQERIAKFIAGAGLCSRRDAEKWIAAGRVSVNGKKITTPAFNVSAKDKVVVDGKPVEKREQTRLWLYHKPAGLVTTHRDPEGRPTVFDALPKKLPRVISVGRLDVNSEGLLLLTNDGELARKLELPSSGWKRRYRVRAYGNINFKMLAELQRGVTIYGIKYRGIDVTLDSQRRGNNWLTVTLAEGKNREIRKIFEHYGCQVSRLIRVAYGPFELGGLPRGEAEEIKGQVLKSFVEDGC